MKKLVTILILIYSITSFAQINPMSDVIYWDGMRIDSSYFSYGIFNDSRDAGAFLSVSEYNQKSLEWKFIKTDDGYYYIINVYSDLYLQPASNPPKEGCKIIQSAPTGNDIQKWRIIPAGSDDLFWVSPKLDENLYITVIGANVSLQKYIDQKNRTHMQKSYMTCFMNDALVLDKNNNFIKIQDIKKGMELLSYNNKTKAIEPAIVDTLLIHNIDKINVYELTFIGADILLASNNENFYMQKLKATENHPILTPNGYMPISDISKGDTIYYYSVVDNKTEPCIVLNSSNYSIENEIVYNVKFTNGNSYIVENIIVSPKCPFVYVKNNNTYQVVSEIIRNQYTDLLDKEEIIELDNYQIVNNILQVKISEEKQEVTYIDFVCLKIDNQIIYPNKPNDFLEKIDNRYYILNTGDFIDLEFYIPDNLINKKINLVVKGYYTYE